MFPLTPVSGSWAFLNSVCGSLGCWEAHLGYRLMHLFWLIWRFHGSQLWILPAIICCWIPLFHFLALYRGGPLWPDGWPPSLSRLLFWLVSLVSALQLLLARVAIAGWLSQTKSCFRPACLTRTVWVLAGSLPRPLGCLPVAV